MDADLFFFADPQPILDEVGDDSIGLIEHRFPENLADLEKYGRFNVGWMTFRNDPIAVSCLQIWREQCIEWCYDRLESGRFAEQKYLDEWPARFPRTRIIQHRGANVAPWNLERFEISLHGQEVRVEVSRCCSTTPTVSSRGARVGHACSIWGSTGVEETPLLLGSIFEPYEEALVDATAKIAVPLALALSRTSPAKHFPFSKR